MSGCAASRKDQNHLERSRADPPRKPALGDNKRGPLNWAPDAGDSIEEFWSDIKEFGGLFGERYAENKTNANSMVEELYKKVTLIIVHYILVFPWL